MALADWPRQGCHGHVQGCHGHVQGCHGHVPKEEK